MDVREIQLFERAVEALERIAELLEEKSEKDRPPLRGYTGEFKREVLKAAT